VKNTGYEVHHYALGLSKNNVYPPHTITKSLLKLPSVAVNAKSKLASVKPACFVSMKLEDGQTSSRQVVLHARQSLL